MDSAGLEYIFDILCSKFLIQLTKDTQKHIVNSASVLFAVLALFVQTACTAQLFLSIYEYYYINIFTQILTTTQWLYE